MVASDVFVAGSECSYEIVTRTKLDTMMTRSRSNTCNLLGRYATTNIRSVRANMNDILHRPTKSSISDGPFAAPKTAWSHMLGKLKKRTMKYQNRRVLLG